jgi:hypothetical protein
MASENLRAINVPRIEANKVQVEALEQQVRVHKLAMLWP